MQLASKANIENVTISFLHINQLIENKKAVNRPEDQIDVIVLKEIQRLNDR